MRKLAGLAVLPLLLALSVPPLQADPTPGPIPVRGQIEGPFPAGTRIELLPVSTSLEDALRLLSGELDSRLATVHPAADGTFVLTAPEPGFYRVAVRAEGFLDLEQTLHQLLAETHLPPVRLRPAHLLEVSVLGTDGKPAAGIAVLGISSDGFFDGWEIANSRAVSGEEGLLRLPWGKKKPLMLVVTSPAFFGQIAPGGDAWTTLRLKARPLADLQAQEADGRPLSGAVLWGGPFALAVTGPDGRLRVASDAPPEVALRLETTDGREASFSFEPGESRRTVTPVPPEVRTGRVLDAVTRKPLSGALVWQLHPREVRVSWARTGPDGAFRLSTIPGSQVLAVAAGRLMATRPEIQPDGSLSLLLEPAVSLAGRVVDTTDQPVAGALVEARPASSVDVDRARTAPDGTFQLHRLGAGQEYRLTVKAGGFLPASLDTTVAAAPGPGGEKQPPLRIVLDRGAAVTGRLLDPAGRPVPGAALSLVVLPEGAMQAQTEEEPLRATSDAAGRFRLEPALPGRFLLDLVHPSLVLPGRPAVDVAGPRPVDLGDVRLGPAAAIEGLVTDGRGTPLPGAEVSLAFLGSGARREPTVSGPDGRFRFGGLAPGRFDLFVSLQGHLPHQAPGVEAPTGEPLRITLRPARSLTGRVVDTGGRPIPGVRLSQVETRELQIANGGQSSGSSSMSLGQTDAEGRFVARHLEPGPVHLSFQADGFRPKVLRGLTIPEEEDPAPVEVVLESGATLSGRVTDGRGRPATGLRIFVYPLENKDPLLSGGAWGETDADGGFRVGGLATGRHRVEVQAWSDMRRLLDSTVEIGSGDQRLDLEVSPGYRISGRVVDEQGEPVRGAILALNAANQQLQAASSSDGTFHFTGVPEGTWRLAFSARGHAPASEEVRLAGGDVDGLTLRLSRAATITGRLLGLTEPERSQVRIAAWPTPGSGSVALSHSQTLGSADGAGGYRVPDVGPGSWTVEASLPSGRHVHGVVRVSAPGEEAVLDLEIPRGLTLSGRVLLDGRPFSGAEVTAATIENGRPTGSWRGTTRHDGTFELQGVEQGRVTLAVLAQGIGQARALDFASDQEVTIEILTGQVSGHVLSAEGQPVEGAIVSLHGEEASLGVSFQGVQTRTGDRGAFELPRVAAGTYRVTVSHPDSAPVEQRIVVTPGGTTRVEAVVQ